MRTTSKILSFLSLISILGNSVFAASPFDILNKYLPDIAVTDIYQETSFFYARVCNLGGTLSESEDILNMAIGIPGGGIVYKSAPVIWDSNNCHNFQIASIDDLKIGMSKTFNISAGAVLRNGRTENVTNNNKLTKSISVVFPSKTLTTIIQPSTYSQGSNTYYCTAANNYCSANTYCNPTNNWCNYTSTYYNNNTYYNNSSSCNYTNNYCNTTNYNNNTYHCTLSNNFCNTNNSAYYNVPSQNIYNTYCNSTNNYCNYTNNYSNYNSNNNSNYNYNIYCNSTNNYCNNSSYYYNNGNNNCTAANNYCNTYNSNYYYNNTSQYDRPDLFIQRLYQNSSDRHIIAEVCNQGGNMPYAISIRTNFVSNNFTTGIYNTIQLARGQCTGTNVFANPIELNIHSIGNYFPIFVTVDTNSNVNELNESNNTMSESLPIWTY